MATSHPRLTERPEPAPQRGGASSSDGPRERLLAELPVVERRLQLNGISTAVLEGGEGPPVVLLHGPGEYAAKWLRVIPDLVTTHRVVAPDLPGHGESEVGPAPLNAARVLGWLEDLIERTCPTPPILAGHVLGGAIAARFASGRGESLARLVLIDALGLAPFAPAPEFGAALSDFVSEPNEETHDRLWMRCAFDLDTLREGMGEQWQRIRAYNLDRMRVTRLQIAQHALMEQFGMPAIPAEELERIAVPAALIWGRHDLATPLAVARAAAARYAWPLHVIDDAGDDPILEQPAAFLNAFRAAMGDSGENRRPIARIDDDAAAWNAIATGYDRTNTPTQMRLGAEGVRRAGCRPGTRFLDVAAGSGALSIPAARAGAGVLAVDQSSAMLSRLEARAREEGLDIEVRRMDGHALALDDDTFDVAGSQFGVMLFPDMPAGIREMARVVRPGGRVLVHAYGDPHRIEFLGFLIRAVQSVRPDFDGPPMDPPPLEFQLADPGRLRAELIAAGLKDVTVETIAETTEFRSGDELWDWVTSSNPIVERVLGALELSAAERGVVRRALDDLVRDQAAGSETAILTSPINIGIGTK